jgi:glycerol uptake facilitator-like aquaporin
MASATQKAAAEFTGTAFLLAAVVGSGIMAQRLAGGNGALALLCNTLATGAILPVIILIFGGVSGAHFNPAVSVAFALRGELTWRMASLYVSVQIAAAIAGAWVAHAMFELPVWQISTTDRSGSGQWLAEAVATFGLLLTIFGCLARAPAAVPYAVGLYITFAGIAPAGIAPFVSAQFAGMLCALVLARWLWEADAPARAGPKPRRHSPL